MRKLLIPHFCLVLFALCLVRSPAHGATCGGATTCACGDTVTSSYTLAANLTCSSGQGLVIGANGLTLDCANFPITRSPAWTNGGPDADFGLSVSGVSGAQIQGVTIKNCNVSGWKTGVRFKEASGNTLRDSNIHDNGDATAKRFYNIEITQNSHANVFDTLTISSAGDENIHCSSAVGTIIRNSTLSNGQNENLYLLGCTQSLIQNNTFGPTGSSPGVDAGYIKDSSNNTFTGNTWRNKVLTLVGASSNNTFTDVSANAGVRLEMYEATPGVPSTYRFPNNNTFTGLAISATNDCIRAIAAGTVTFVGGSLATCATRINSSSADSAGAFAGPTTLTFVSLDPYAGPVIGDGGVTINVGWKLDVHVQKTGPVALAGALVQLLDSAGQQVFAFFTDAAGDIPQQSVTIRSGTMPVRLTPHRLLITLPGYAGDSQDVLLSSDTVKTVTMGAQ